MKSLFEIHPIQAKILRKLLFNPEVRFSDLNSDKVPTDQFNFHLKSLVSSKLLEKSSTGKYKLTNSGKEFANRFDTEKLIIERQAKPTVVIGCRRTLGDKREYLVHKRLKNPSYGFHGYITGKIRWGETVLETAKRELKEETGLNAEKMSLVGVEHKMDYHKDGSLLEDKFFFVVVVEQFSGEMVNYEGGENIWVEKDRITKLPRLFDDMENLMNMFESHSFTFSEVKYTVSDY